MTEWTDEQGRRWTATDALAHHLRTRDRWVPQRWARGTAYLTAACAALLMLRDPSLATVAGLLAIFWRIDAL